MELSTQLNFFNTISLKGEELKEAKETCEKQNERVLFLMKQIGQPLTPFDVHRIYVKKFSNVLIGSVRRSMTVLTKKGKLEKLEEMKPGNYGKPNHKWRIKS